MNDYTGYTIDEQSCIECGQCRRFCPIAGAIRIDERYQHVINADICTGCGLCEAFCPVPGTLIKHGAQKTTARQERLLNLRRIVWRGKWGYHDHPLLGALTHQARQRVQEYQRGLRALAV